MSSNPQDDLAYVVSAVRRQDRPVGLPSIFFLWAVIIAIGFSMADWGSQFAGVFWLVAGIGGGALSWFLGARAERRSGIRDVAEGRRYGLHWLVGGAAYVLTALPMLTGRVAAPVGATYYLLLTGLLYALAGIHLQRGLLPSGLICLVGFAVVTLVAVPYVWTVTGCIIAVALVLAGLSAHRAIANGARA